MSSAPQHGGTARPEAGEGPQPSVPGGPRRPAPSLDFDDPLCMASRDDTDEGWGDRPSGGGGAADLARFLDEKPPHHL